MNDDAMPEEAVDVDALVAFLRREFDSADQYYEQIKPLQEQAYKYYEAQPFGNEVDGRSQVILPDVQEVIDYMAQSVLRTFVSGERTVEFEAKDEGEEEAVEEASAAIDYVFMRQQDGYRTLHDGAFDGLLRKYGVFKTAVETVEKVTRETVVIDDPDMLGFLPEGVTVEQYDEAAGTATIKTERREKRFVDCAVPVNEFRFSVDARHEDTAGYLCQITPKTRSELVEMGFDREQVYSLPRSSNSSTYRLTESTTLDGNRYEEASTELEIVDLCEEYARIDLDGDGIAERVKVFRVESEVLIDAETGQLALETVEEQPFAVFSPFPRPHALVGWSLADKVLDIQLARSFVARQMFDGLAYGNMPRLVVDSGMADVTTYQDILSPIPGSPIRARGGAAAVQPLSTGFDIGKSMQAMEWLSGERESRTGITRLNQGLDADTLNKTATGTALMQSQGQQGEEMIARQLAETMSRLFLKKYRLMRAEGEPFKIKVGGQYREVDPSRWPEDVNVVVKVGLGTNSKDRRIQYRMAMSQALTASVQQGMSGPEHVFKWFDGMARDTGIGQGDDFAFDPAQQPPQQDKPDPETMKVQAEAQMQQAKIAGEQQLAQTRLELAAQEAAAKQDLAREQAEFDAQLAAEKAQRESDLAQQRMVMEERLAEQRLAMEMRMAAHKAQMAQAQTDAKISQNRPGGSLDA